MKPHIVLSVPGVRSASRPRVLTESTKQLGNAEHIPVIEFDYAFATDIPGDPNRKISRWLRQIQFMGQFSLLWHGERVDRTIM